MAYIGRDIDNGLLTKQTFTGVNGSTTEFTLDQYVSDATQLIVSVAGVIQEPNVAFTASDDTLTFTGAPANGAAVWAIYLGKTIAVTGTAGAGSINVQTGTGNGSATPVTLSNSVTTEAEIFVSLNGIAQLPGSDYTASGTTLTFSTSPTAADAILVYYFSAAGILNVVADGAVTAAGFAASGTLPAWNGNALTNLDSADLSGTLPAINSSNLTGLVEGLDTTSASDPTVTTNPGTGVGTMWLNSSSGELYCCTDATTNDNIWKNVGGGAGHIIAPTNANDTFPDLAESATTNFTFAGGTDDGTVTHYFVDQISNTSLLGVTASEVAAGSAHSFVTQAVGSDTSVTFRVRTKDNLGLYSPGITITTIIENDEPPTNPNNGGSFADMNQNTTGYNYTFAGATDDKGVTHYMVDQISNAALTVSAAEVTAGSAHSFNTGSVGSNTAVTFRVRAKDTVGQYSSGVTVSMTVLSVVYTAASGGDHTYTRGNYTYRIFKNSGTLQVTTVGTDPDLDYLVVAGGAGSGGWGAGGAGGVKSSVTNTGQNGSLLSSITASVTSYNITIGAGGNGAGSVGNTGSDGSSSAFHSVTSTGGGGGAGWASGANGNGRQGGSGGSGNRYYGGNPGPGIAGEGYAGGDSTTSGHSAGGGGGAGAVGGNGGGAGQAGGDGGIGVTSVMMNTSESNTYSVGDVKNGSVYFAGGGGGAAGSVPPLASGGHGGGGRGGNNAPISPIAGTEYTGGGAGSPYNSADTKNGGKGVVIVRYKTS